MRVGWQNRRVRRPFAWLALAPFVATGVLAAHAIAYSFTGTPTGAEHDYLEHAPDLLSVAVLVAVCAVALVQRMGRPSPWPLSVAAVAAFVLQEHLEQFAHTGHVPWLLTTPMFAVGLLLQIPVAALAWLLASRLLSVAEGHSRARRPHLPRVLLDLPGVRHAAVQARVLHVHCARGPPLLLSR
jgi:hypothetical protein